MPTPPAARVLFDRTNLDPNVQESLFDLAFKQLRARFAACNYTLTAELFEEARKWVGTGHSMGYICIAVIVYLAQRHNAPKHPPSLTDEMYTAAATPEPGVHRIRHADTDEGGLRDDGAALATGADGAEDETAAEEQPVAKRRRADARRRQVAGEFEGEQLLDYAEVIRRCLPPTGQLYGEQFQAHHKALRTLAPPKIFFTDGASCAIDSFNMGAGREVLSRESFQPAASTPSPSSGISRMGMSFGSCREVPATSEAVKLDDDRGQSVLKSLGFALDPIGGKKKPPHLQQILKQKGGVFLFEFHWRRLNAERGHHVIVVNCHLRLVFCNTLGAIPFTLGTERCRYNVHETPSTHDNVANQFHIVNVTRVWRMLEVPA